MNLIGSDSPLSLLPRGIDPKQRLFLDAIRVSAHFVGLAYKRLIENLEKSIPPENREKDCGLKAMVDAWSIVDSVYRLRQLVQRMPRYRDRMPSKQVFLRSTSDAEDLRHAIQHLDTDIETLLKAGQPPMGALTWIVPIDKSEGTMRIESFIPGQLEEASPGSLVSVPPDVPEHIDQVELWASEYRVNLSELYRAVAKLVSSLETSLRPQCPELPRGPADTWVSMTIQVAPAGYEETG